jgi:hypothetical protein
MRWFTRMSLAALAALALAPPAHALKMTAVDIMTSTIKQEKQSSFSGLAARARMTSPIFIQGIEFMPTMEYWRSASTVDAFGIRTARKDATVVFDVRYAFKSSGTRPYLGVGYGLHFMSASVDAPNYGISNASQALTKGGFDALGGLAFPLTQKIENFLELKYHNVTGYRQFKFSWGVSINL